MRPATIVGSANGRSITELTMRLPRKSSRTITQAISVPITALIATMIREVITVSLIAATASGSVIAFQNALKPSSVERRTTARERDQHDQAQPGEHDPAGEHLTAEGGSEARLRRGRYRCVCGRRCHLRCSSFLYSVGAPC